MFKKLVLADTFSIFADTTFNSSLEYLNSSSAWIGAVSYYFQMYFDFSGYCDMAIGAGLLFNIKLPLNFNSPYKALNIQDFWRRWHITLSRWLKDFIYIPLGGSRCKHWKTISNVVFVFLIGGIWHGANWTFVVWGLFHGIGIAVFIFWKKLNIKIPRILSYIITQAFILLLWVFFRSKDIDHSVNYFNKMFDFCELYKLQDIFNHVCTSHLSLTSIEIKFHDMNAVVVIYWSILTIMSFILIIKGLNYSSLILNKKCYTQRYKAIFCAIVVFGCIVLRPILRESPFIYFNF